MAKRRLSFRHAPLAATQIRLVQVSSDPGKPIECSIAVYDISATPKYTCLSYMWRRTPTDNESCLIQLNGKSYRVAQNLADFLYVAPWKYCDVYFWIDALCIDQDNFEERSDQVRQMSRIYSDAARTVAWLGQSDGAENLQLHNQSRRPRASRRSSGMSSQEAAIFNQIVQHDYWKRTWIVQEQRFSENTEILLGDVRISTSRLVELNDLASRFIRSHGHEHSEVEPFKEATRSLLLSNRNEKLPMTELLKLHHKTSCSDARDKVHALLAMAIEGSAIEIDYTSTYVDLALRTIWACQNSFCMCLPTLLFSALDIHRVDEELKSLPHPFIEILIGCYHYDEKKANSRPLLRTCKCKNQSCFQDGGPTTQKGIVLCLKSICGFSTSAHMLISNQRVIHWGTDYPPVMLQWPPLVNIRYAKRERFEMTISISFTPAGLFEFTHAVVAWTDQRDRSVRDASTLGHDCQKSAKNVFYRVLGHGLIADNATASASDVGFAYE